MISNCFYYGVYSPQGFYSLASRPNFSAKRNYILKSYSEKFKQSVFDSLKAVLDSKSMVYTDFCADDRSIGVYCGDADFRIIDGTYENYDSVPADCIFDFTKDVDNQCKEILEIRKQSVSRAERFLSACRCINNDMVRLDVADMDIAKINRYTSRLWSNATDGLRGSIGTEHKRFVTCITPEGVELNPEAFDIYCERVITVCDRSGACAGRIVDRMRRYALSSGYDVISCICPLNVSAGPEHLIIPELKLGIFTCKYYHRADFENGRRVSAGRFLVNHESTAKHRMDFSFKAYRRLMQEVFMSLENVRVCDDELDGLCYPKNDKQAVSDIVNALL